MLSPDTKFKITIGGAVVMAATLVGFGWQAQSTLSSINDSVKSTNLRLDSVESKLNERLSSFETVMSDRFTKTAAAEWALRMLNANPSLKIPDPRDPSRMLNGWYQERSMKPEVSRPVLTGR